MGGRGTGVNTNHFIAPPTSRGLKKKTTKTNKFLLFMKVIASPAHLNTAPAQSLRLAPSGQTIIHRGVIEDSDLGVEHLPDVPPQTYNRKICYESHLRSQSSCQAFKGSLFFVFQSMGKRRIWAQGWFCFCCCSTSSGHWGESTYWHIASPMSSSYNTSMAPPAPLGPSMH